MKKLAILIYPEFSLQEIGDLMYLFRWHYDIQSVMVSTSTDVVVSEEGVRVLPEVICDDFRMGDYCALALPGCSDFRVSIRNPKIKSFLESFKGNHDFVIGAICGGPLFLSQAGLLDDCKFTNALYVQMNDELKFIRSENLVYQPVVVDGGRVSAVGNAHREFAIAMARAIGLECHDDAMSGPGKAWKQEDFKYYLREDDYRIFKEEFHEFLD